MTIPTAPQDRSEESSLSEGYDSFSEVLLDLRTRRMEVERRLGALKAEGAQLDVAIEALEHISGNGVPPSNRTSAIVQHVTDAGRWLTHAEIIRGMRIDTGLQGARLRHTVRTQIGQLVTRGTLRQVGALIGLPGWDEPGNMLPPMANATSMRTGRTTQIAMVLREAGRPLHVTEIVSDLIARGLDGDSRCVAASLAQQIKNKSSRWRQVGPATYASNEVDTEQVGDCAVSEAR